MTGAERVRAAFDRRREGGQAALVIYLTYGDPGGEQSIDIAAAAARAGADVIELGVPFSDPSADGAVIQAAMERALERGASLSSALQGVARLRAAGQDVPVVLFGYYNPIITRGLDQFADDAKAAGVDAVLTVDLPMDELDELGNPLSERGIGVIPLVAPTTGQARIEAVRSFAPPFVYYISMTGVTGASIASVEAGPDRVAAIRKATGAPVAVGFGIRTPEDARRVAAYADGVVIGSEVIRRIADGDGPGAADRVARYVGEVRAALAGNGS